MKALTTLIFLSLCAPALAASPDIVISQVYGAGGNGSGATLAPYKHDFIELFNRSGASVNRITFSRWNRSSRNAPCRTRSSRF